MNDTAPKSQGILAVAVLFGLVAGGVALVMFDYELPGAALIGLIVALLVAVVLSLGWREPAAKKDDAPIPARTVAAAPTATATPAPAPAAAAPAPAPKPDPAPAPVVEAAPVVAASDGPGEKPASLSEARGGTPDDLKQIKGVGPKLEAMLHRMGYFHFDQIASWGPSEVAWVDQNLEGFKGRVSRDNWVSQAQTLADGGSTEFSKKVGKGDVY